MDAKSEFSIVGARVNRVDRPLPGVYALTLASGDARAAVNAVWLVFAPPLRGAPQSLLVSERPRGESADAAVRGLREKLEGGRIRAVFQTRAALSFEVVSSDIVWWVVSDQRGLACSPSSPRPEVTAPLGPLPIERDAAAVDRVFAAILHERARRTLDVIQKLHTRLGRRITAIEGDLEEARTAALRGEEALLFLAEASRAKRGATELVATDWSTGEPRELRFPLDPAKTAHEQVAAVFAEAKRRRHGEPLARSRIAEAESARALLTGLQRDVAVAESSESIDALVRAADLALPAGVRVLAGPSLPSTKKTAPRVGYRRYRSETGAVVLVGRDARGNDDLTVNVARPGDLWLHARGAAGSHVVVPGGARGGAPDATALIDAATLAAHFSAERGEATVDVAYVDRRYVRKRKGSPIGMVEVTHEKVLALRVEAGRLARLLATCDT